VTEQLSDHLALLTHLIELAQHLPRGILITSVGFGLCAERRHEWIVA